MLTCTEDPEPEMTMRRGLGTAAVVLVAGCGGDGGSTGPSRVLAIIGGDNQSARVNQPLPLPLSVSVTEGGSPVEGATVNWSVVTGSGTITPTSTTGSDGIAAAAYTVGSSPRTERIQAAVAGAAGFQVFSATAVPIGSFRVLGGGNNVPDRFSSDLALYGSYGYTGTWGQRGVNLGDAVKVWRLDAGGAPALVRSVAVPDIEIVSDVGVSPDGSLLVITAEGGSNPGLLVYSLANPADPVLVGRNAVGAGLHTGTVASINGKTYAFTARNPGAESPALQIYDLGNPASPTVVAVVPVPPNYGIHDTFVRDGLVFAFVWNTGVQIYDVGNGVAGGSISNPALVGGVITSGTGVPGGHPSAHNGWWFHNPNTGERRYVFVGQEGPIEFGVSSSGDIHVVDVSDLAHPREVAFFHLEGAGSHNFWMDEANEILYAAFYNGGVVALDVSGTLIGDLATREVARIEPAGAGTFVWGVQLHQGSLYAIDMLSGLWQLEASGF
jgi:hypothetical protein